MNIINKIKILLNLLDLQMSLIWNLDMLGGIERRLNMTVWIYDILDGDKGIIFAPTEAEAEQIFKENYDNEIVDGYHEPYESGKCMINRLTVYYGGEEIVPLLDNEWRWNYG